MFTNPVIQNLSLLAGRIMLSAIFILSGFNKLKGFSGGGTQKYMEAMGVPGALLPLVVVGMRKVRDRDRASTHDHLLSNSAAALAATSLG